MQNKKKLGLFGEEKAVRFLLENNYTILERNLRSPFGEIDIVAQKEDQIYFFEVKTRSSLQFGEGWEAVTKRKFQRIFKTAETYIQSKNLDKDVHFGVISILHTKKGWKTDLFWYD